MIKLGIIHGGVSTEHEVSEMSSKSIMENLNKEKYDIYDIYINKYGKWFERKDGKEEEIYNLIWYLKELDVVFPVLHGLWGEDGTIQGMLEMLQVPYVGCGVLASSVGMDKVYAKIIFDKAGINQTPYVYVYKKKDGYIIINENFDEEEFELEKITSKLKFPMFVKPSNSGSSVGVKKVESADELKDAIEYAGRYDCKILIEQGVIGREFECAILGEEEVIASTIGEIASAEEYYSFDAKYNIPESKTIIPAKIDENIINEVRRIAIKAFKAIDGKGLSRVDFFVENETNKIFINEINTMPGFTKISMYPKLFEAVGVPYSELLDRLIAIPLNNK